MGRNTLKKCVGLIVYLYILKKVSEMIYMFVACCGWHMQQQKRRGLKGMESLDSDSE
jgi:hypothetical protein